MNNPILSMHTWVTLPSEQRARIRALFAIPRSGHVVVNDGVIETDGTSVDDFRHLTTEKMQTYLKDDSTDFYKLFDKVVARIQDEIEGKPFIEEPIVIIKEEVVDANTKNHGKKSKQK